MSKSLILIPDISGFTKFVNNTEIRHSQHIISELLEVIIESNELNLKVSEVEGDAILFIKENQVPALRDLIRQSESMFINFHRHLKQYDSLRICNCGACTTASRLSLKIIVHAGEIGFTVINQRKKPFGPALIIAHRLLKNSVPDEEYVLFSDAFFTAIKNLKLSEEPAAQFIEGHSDYDELGKVNYRYLPLQKLKKSISEVEPIKAVQNSHKPLFVEEEISCSASDVFEIISNLEYRIKWLKGVSDIIYTKNRINRAGTRHICIFPGSEVEFETLKGDSEKNQLVYGERMNNVPAVRDISFYYILNEVEGITKTKVEIYFHPTSLAGRLLLPFIKHRIRKITQKGLASLKEFCESGTFEII